jgi:membrane peptidoglycan carboxypeptidase
MPLSDDTARAGVLASSNVFGPRSPPGLNREARGKPTDALNAWTIGYTPSRVVAVWTGTHADKSNLTPRLSATMECVDADRHRRSARWKAGRHPQTLTAINVCDPSGMLPICRMPEFGERSFLERQLNRSQPDNMYRKFAINRETGLPCTGVYASRS